MCIFITLLQQRSDIWYYKRDLPFYTYCISSQDTWYQIGVYLYQLLHSYAEEASCLQLKKKENKINLYILYRSLFPSTKKQSLL